MYSPHVGGCWGESGSKGLVLALRGEDKSRMGAVSDEDLGDGQRARRGVGNTQHRVIARIKVCADEFQKEEGRRFSVEGSV